MRTVTCLIANLDMLLTEPLQPRPSNVELHMGRTKLQFQMGKARPTVGSYFELNSNLDRPTRFSKLSPQLRLLHF